MQNALNNQANHLDPSVCAEPKTIHVLMLNRLDADHVPGGDTVQMLRTKAGLEKLGVEVRIGCTEDLNALSDYDIVHVFNWQQLRPVLDRWPTHGLVPRLVLSPIFWFHAGHWFDDAVQVKWIWKLARSGLGHGRACDLYDRWQQAKFSWGNEGKKLRKLFSVPVQFLPNSTTELVHLETVLGMKGKLKPRTTVVPNGIELGLFEPLPKVNMPFQSAYGIKDFVLQVARIQSAKNQLGLIEALYDVPVPIVFVGQPSPYEKEYVERCYAVGEKRGNVYFLGPLSPEEIAGIYVQAAIHVLPSWRETPGLVSLEAAASGCKVVTTSIGSTREYFGDEAWYCNPKDPASIRQAVMDALKAPANTTLRARVLQQYTWHAAALATKRAYVKALNTNSVEK